MLHLKPAAAGCQLVLVSHRASGSRDVWMLHQGKNKWVRTAIEDDQGGGQVEESLACSGRPHEDLLFSPPSARALSLALRRLPARALGRIKSVCQSWRAIIDSDRFILSHNDYHWRLSSSTILFTCFPPNKERAATPLGSPRVPPLTDRRTFVSKPCHGLALLTCGGITALFNPVTRLHRYLSIGGYVFLNHLVPRRCCVPSIGIGLGYDRSREGHVLVALIRDDGKSAMECRVWRLSHDPSSSISTS